MSENRKYAIISDIHGNVDALLAVLNDAAMQNVTHYIFLGDYTGCNCPNEAVDNIRQIKNSFVIHGNGEAYIKNIVNQSESTWTSEQLAPLYWNYKALSQENKDYLINLPSRLTITTNEKPIHLAHAPFDFFGKTKADELGGRHYAMQMREKPFNHSDYLNHASVLLNSDEALRASLSILPDGVYLFGHFHTQWYLEIDNKLLINPGSCGWPFDYDTRSPYTIISFTDGNLSVEERRVSYDIENVISKLRLSSFYKDTNIWGILYEKGLKTAINQVLFYLDFVEKIANDIGDYERPFSNTVWRLAQSNTNFSSKTIK